MKQLIKNTNKLVKKIRSKPEIEGFVELFSHEKIEGWAIHKRKKPLNLELKIKENVYPLTPIWQQRDDVSAKYGFDYNGAGFTIELPGTVKNKLAHEQLQQDDIQLKVNNTVIRIATDIPRITKKLEATSELEQQPTIKPSRPTDNTLIAQGKHGKALGYVYSVENFIIYGTLLDTTSPHPIEVTVNDVIQSFTILYTPIILDSLDLAEAKGQAKNFEIELPGYLWEEITANSNSLKINLVFEQAISPIELTIDEKSASSWLHQISNMPEVQHKQYLSLLAIEHLRFSMLRDTIDLRTKAYYQQFAEKMQLEDFLQKNKNKTTADITPVEYHVDISTQLLWKAQKTLNQLLLQDVKPVYDCVLQVIRSQKLVGSVKKQFIQSIIPLLAKKNELIKLKQIINFQEFYSLDHADNAWPISLSIAPLVADKQINRAADALWRLAKNPNSGWLNTECIFFAVQFAQELEEHGDIAQAEAEKLRYAFVGLLDSLHGEWFSRLHDALLQQAMVTLLQKLYLMTDYQRQDVLKAALRHYGLSPSFWQLIETANLQTLNSSLFQRAQQHWHTVHNAFSNTPALPQTFMVVHKALNFFQLQDNPEATYFRRELLANLLPLDGIDQEQLLEVLNDSIGDDMMEAVRYAAHPLINDQTATSLLTQHSTEISSALRLNTERASSVNHVAQCAAANALQASNLQLNRLVPIHNWPAMFLSVDVLTSRLLQEPDLIEQCLPQLNDYFQHIIAQNKSDFYLPAPACTALANLQVLKHNSLIKHWLADIEQLLTHKFGVLHEPLFKARQTQKTILPLTQPGWPQDTLVVIYSCRAYLDSRIKAIRETWIKDLQARNIPYVILVGDGDDQLHDDVLALDVSDTYEDLPQKTLKLFDWVYNNTQAQYVLKIDDDCYLDVDRYFNSLTYRKHHYYGRVIHRGIGGMDRTWHHAKSKTLRAQKAIDKSPEPSLYADGGGGYTLSRIAMAALINNANSLIGERLIANSFMEDKLVGDLLAISHIQPSNEDYECYQRRRTFGAATTVGIRENLFYSNEITPTVVTHLDTDKDQSFAEEIMKGKAFWPKKIWPTGWAASIRENANQLELLTDINKLKALAQEKFFVVAAMRNEMIMLPHFLKHYRELGVKVFIISDNCSDDGTREYLLQQQDVILYSADTEYKHSHYGVAWQQAMLANHCVGKWALIADADELLMYPDYQNTSLPAFVARAEEQGADCIRTDMIDMYPFGNLSEADFTNNSPFEVANWHDKEPLKEWHIGSGYYSNRISSVSTLRHRLDVNAEPNAFTSQKYALVKYRPWIRVSQGIHDIAGIQLHSISTWFAHFKYHSGFKEKIEEEIKRKQHYDGAKEYQRYASMLAEVKGDFGNKNESIKFNK
ncbi:glycosyltransferase family 2 protein [Oceanisphaera sp. IT1-181]|uniref:glycosyltransferase family 2 protein n=1 Tax=Oceanisphaera sp. IT1-181 TaxID=3081199 RepID=UPI0029CA8111|nr:glycosyltransferase family 2 protein [Oceanisphaera sp. IT1-181]